MLTLATGGAFLVGYLIAWIAIPDEPMRPNPFGAPADEVGYAAGGNPSYADYPADYIAPAPRERSYLGWLVLSAAILAAGVLGLIGFLLPASAGVWGVILGVALAILGIGMLVGAKYGRARWLLWFAIPLAFITFATVSASNFVRDNPNWDRWVASTQADGQWGGLSLGERVWQVGPPDVEDSPLEYRLSAGSATLDLTGLTARGATESTQDGQRLTIDAGVGLGELIIVIPGDMQLDLTGSVDVGQIDLPQQLPIDRSNEDVDGTDLDVVTTLDPVAKQASRPTSSPSTPPSAPETWRCAVRQHETDYLSLAAGLIFTVLGVLFDSQRGDRLADRRTMDRPHRPDRPRRRRSGRLADGLEAPAAGRRRPPRPSPPELADGPVRLTQPPATRDTLPVSVPPPGTPGGGTELGRVLVCSGARVCRGAPRSIVPAEVPTPTRWCRGACS